MQTQSHMPTGMKSNVSVSIAFSNISIIYFNPLTAISVLISLFGYCIRDSTSKLINIKIWKTVTIQKCSLNSIKQGGSRIWFLCRNTPEFSGQWKCVEYISTHCMGDLQKCDVEEYTAILERLHCFLQGQWIFQQNKTRAHSVRATKALWLHGHSVLVLDWPGPELSPIESLSLSWRGESDNSSPGRLSS